MSATELPCSSALCSASWWTRPSRASSSPPKMGPGPQGDIATTCKHFRTRCTSASNGTRVRPTHIIDYLKFVVAHDAIEKELTAFNRALNAGRAGGNRVRLSTPADGDEARDSGNAEFWDEDLVAPYKHFRQLAENSKSWGQLLAGLQRDVENARKLWGAVVRNDTGRQVVRREGTAGLRAVDRDPPGHQHVQEPGRIQGRGHAAARVPRRPRVQRVGPAAGKRHLLPLLQPG